MTNKFGDGFFSIFQADDAIGAFCFFVFCDVASFSSSLFFSLTKLK